MSIVLKRLSRAFTQDPLIDEYAILPEATHELIGGGDSGEEEEVGVIVSEHKLAISVEAALVLYRYASQRMRNTRKRLVPTMAALRSVDGKQSEKKANDATGPVVELSASAVAGEAYGKTTASAVSATDADEIVTASRAVLLCCADNASGWSCRSLLLRIGATDVTKELRFNALVLRTNHKSGEGWAFRRILFAANCGESGLDESTLSAAAADELALVEDVAKRYDHHYYAWNHWAWIERFVAARSRAPSSFPRLAYVTPSHYGLFHHRIVRLLELFRKTATATCHGQYEAEKADILPPTAQDAYASERRLSDDLLATFPYLEAPWLFRSQLFAALLQTVEATSSVVSLTSIDSSIGGPLCPKPSVLRRIVELWRTEVLVAGGSVDGSCSGGALFDEKPSLGADSVDSATATACRLRWRFRLHILQEMAMCMFSWRKADGTASEETLANFAAAGTHELEVLEVAVTGGPQAQCLLLDEIRQDLKGILLTVGAACSGSRFTSHVDQDHSGHGVGSCVP
eukprot:TRINITY_DN54677_c0_g1_i1.p1 TRINITY_DN54677_c0_g1~~TRINITY_DN54677_c0_g1_i1.p1  ORF type:complete len:517 (-),score=109.76 TRINITY_DN54677_c0_g1_i1:220-1770(-)